MRNQKHKDCVKKERNVFRDHGRGHDKRKEKTAVPFKERVCIKIQEKRKRHSHNIPRPMNGAYETGFRDGQKSGILKTVLVLMALLVIGNLINAFL